MAEHTMSVDDGGGRERRVPVTYSSNSKNRAQQPEKTLEREPIEQVVTGKVTRRKKGLAGRLGENVISEDAAGVGAYILFEVLLPAAKNAVSDAVSQGIERILFGEVRTRSSTRPGYTSYNRVGTRPTPNLVQPRTLSHQARAMHNFDEVILQTSVEAEEVLNQLLEILTKYGSATVGNLYNLIGVIGSFTDERWGWQDLRTASIRRVRDGYLLNLPQPEPLD